MKKILLSFIACLLLLPCYSQTKTDSLKHLLGTLLQNERRLEVLLELSKPQNNDLIQAIRYGREGLELSEKLNLPKKQEDFMYAVGLAYYVNHDYPKSIEMAFKGLELSDAIGDIEYHSTFLYGISVCYADAGDLNAAISYAHKDIALLKKTHIHAKAGNQETISNLYGCVARYYMKLNRLDSALLYMQQSYRIGMAVNYEDIGSTILGLGMIEEELGHNEPAASYYRLAVRQSAGHDKLNVIQAYRRLARLYKKTGDMNAAFENARQAFGLAQQSGDVAAIYETSQLLSDLYQGKDELKSLQYYKIAAIHKDSLNIADKAKEFEIITSREKQHELELEEEKAKEADERKENLQLIAIAVFIPAFILVVLQLNKTRIHRKLIDFMGILSLLLLFEFITLLIHPWAGKLTHHTPVIELLILVALSSILVPLHHRLDHWIKAKLSSSGSTTKKRKSPN